MRFQLWPSGHSAAYTIVAEFATEEDAAKAVEPLMNLEDVESVAAKGKRTICGVYVDSMTTTHIEDLIRETPSPGPTGVQTYLLFQALKITVDLPADPDTSNLLLDKEEVRAIQFLKANSEWNLEDMTFRFDYAGEAMLGKGGILVFPFISPFTLIKPEFVLKLADHKNWHVADA